MNWYPHKKRDEERAEALKKDCSKCGAKVGEPCKTESGKPFVNELGSNVHRDRIVKFCKVS